MNSQLSVLKELIKANLNNNSLDEGVRKIFEKIDPDKIETAIIHMVGGEAKKIRFDSLSAEEIGTLLRKASNGEVLTEEEEAQSAFCHFQMACISNPASLHIIPTMGEHL